MRKLSTQYVMKNVFLHRYLNCSDHSLDHLDELPPCQLDSFGVSFNPDQTAAFGVLRDTHRHFVLLLDPIDCREGEGE